MKLKLIILTLFLGVGLLISCSKEDKNISSTEALLNGTWNLKNLSGGFAGLNENYSIGTITWAFNVQNKTIIVNNNVPESKKYIFDNGTYSFSIIEINNHKYLKINNDEYGGLIILNSNLTIDQNKISNGVGADGFILNFEK
ncbi:MAG TPA: hypothetical protein PKX92_08120 [Edaphocola sp.]|nr:hypothetical protein [Edaphocola sp.]